jgi:hypothetical protein
MPKQSKFSHAPAAARAALCSLVLAAAGLAGLLVSPAASAADVGVSIGFSQPGVYGRIDIGRFPQPELIVAKPVVIRPARVMPQPVYLWVPPGHQKNWGKHCHRYNACGAPVYFVKEDWYRKHVHQHHPAHGNPHGRHDDHKGRGRGHD